MLLPSVIDENFLDQTECDDIKRKVLLLNKKKDSDKHISACTLPPGMYTKNYDRNGISDSNKVMMENFSVYYEKIKSRLELHYKHPIDFHPKLQLPGFHIFSNNKDTEGSWNKVNFHQDVFEEIKRYVKVGTIDSIIIPIELPATGGSLVYNTDRKIDDRHTFSIESDKKFIYKKGTMAVWPGNLMHSIGPFSLSKGEYRITMQMHINLVEAQGTVFW